jgi:hypothetical protein
MCFICFVCVACPPSPEYYNSCNNIYISSICGGATGNHVTGSDVRHVTGSGHARKYVLRMHNIRPSGAFSPEVTSDSPHQKWLEPCPKYVLRMPGSRFFLSSSTTCSTVVPWLPGVTKGHVTPTPPEAFSHNASLFVIINYPDRWRYYLVTW